MNTPDPFALQCPLPLRDYPIVTLAHGGGGRLMHELIERVFLAAFDNPLLFASRIVLGIFRKIAMRARFCNRGNDTRAVNGLQAMQLQSEFFSTNHG